MNIIPIVVILVFFAVLLLINRRQLGVQSFTEYATANRAIGTLGVTLAIFSTWYVGAMFTAWAGFAVGFGMIAFYVTPYAIFTIFTMYLCGPRVHIWGKKYGLDTQGDLCGFRYKSNAVRMIVGGLGVLWTIPWVLMEWVTQGYIFEYASGGYFPSWLGMLIGVAVVLVYVSLGGMRSVITANIFQGAFMFIIGNILMIYLVNEFFGGFGPGFDKVLQEYPAMLTYPGPGWSPSTPYWTSIVITSSFGAFMWPWIFNKLFAAGSIRQIKKSTIYAPILGMIFYGIFVYMGTFCHLLEVPRSNPQEAFLWLSAQSGIIPLSLMSTMIMAASVATVAGVVQAMSSAISKDIAQVIKKNISDKAAIRVARWAVVGICALAFIGALVDVGLLIFWALLTYQGIIMIYPVVMFGLFWKRANKEGALTGMIVGTAVSMILHVANPAWMVELGWTSGMYGLAVALLITWVFGFFKPPTEHVDQLWKDIEDAKRHRMAGASSAS